MQRCFLAFLFVLFLFSVATFGLASLVEAQSKVFFIGRLECLICCFLLSIHVGVFTAKSHINSTPSLRKNTLSHNRLQISTKKKKRKKNRCSESPMLCISHWRPYQSWWKVEEEDTNTKTRVLNTARTTQTLTRARRQTDAWNDKRTTEDRKKEYRKIGLSRSV